MVYQYQLIYWRTTDNIYDELLVYLTNHWIIVQTIIEQQQVQDQLFMALAIEQARKSEVIGEIPVGAVLIHQGKVVAQAGNNCIDAKDPCGHAEVQVLRQAAQILGNYRLIDTTLYVTLEPCAMCAGALVHARVKRLVFATHDFKTGAAGSAFTLLNSPKMNHQIDVCHGVLGQECSKMLSDFFKRRRAAIKASKQG